MNFGTLKEHVIRNLGGRGDLETLAPEWLNTSYLDVITTGKFPEARKMQPIPCPNLDATTTFDTATDDEDYLYSAIDSDLLFPITLRDTTNNQSLFLKDIRWYDRYKAESSGKPQRYVIYSNTIYLDPTPNDTYTIQIRFRKKIDIPVLTAAEDTPVIEELWHEALEVAATYRGARSLGYPDADKWLRDLKNILAAHSEQFSEEESDARWGVTIVM